MQLNLMRIAQSPLRYVGLAPGQALTNARPNPRERERQRREQWTYIQSRFDDAPAPMPATQSADFARSSR